MKTIKISAHTGSFAENKDVAMKIRTESIAPSIEKNEDITIDFENIESVTQSFIHALLSQLIRHYGVEVLDSIKFRNCSEPVKKIINMVVDYMQEG